jgi:hypothetical protein
MHFEGQDLAENSKLLKTALKYSRGTLINASGI